MKYTYNRKNFQYKNKLRQQARMCHEATNHTYWGQVKSIEFYQVARINQLKVIVWENFETIDEIYITIKCTFLASQVTNAVYM